MKYGVVITKQKKVARAKRVALCECDVCNTRFRQPLHKIVSKFTPCSKACYTVLRSKGGKLYEERIRRNLECHGVEWTSQLESVKEKQANTNLMFYGAVCSQLNADVRAKTVATNMSVRGVPYSVMDPNVQAKSRLTMVERHGAPYFPSSNAFRNSVDWCARNEKSYFTKLKNGTHENFTSIPETHLYEILVEIFGKDAVKRWQWVNGWNIDMIVETPERKISCQLDGVFWHGLSMPEEELRRRGYDTILATREKDQKQCEWFANENEPFFRITDLHLKKLQKQNKHDKSKLLNEIKDLLFKAYK